MFLHITFKKMRTITDSKVYRFDTKVDIVLPTKSTVVLIRLFLLFLQATSTDYPVSYRLYVVLYTFGSLMVPSFFFTSLWLRPTNVAKIMIANSIHFSMMYFRVQSYSSHQCFYLQVPWCFECGADPDLLTKFRRLEARR